jgi:hypothetical protein
MTIRRTPHRLNAAGRGCVCMIDKSGQIPYLERISDRSVHLQGTSVHSLPEAGKPLKRPAPTIRTPHRFMATGTNLVPDRKRTLPIGKNFPLSSRHPWTTAASNTTEITPPRRGYR